MELTISDTEFARELVRSIANAYAMAFECIDVGDKYTIRLYSDLYLALRCRYEYDMHHVRLCQSIPYHIRRLYADLKKILMRSELQPKYVTFQLKAFSVKHNEALEWANESSGMDLYCDRFINTYNWPICSISDRWHYAPSYFPSMMKDANSIEGW